jgi:hypothetical protein
MTIWNQISYLIFGLLTLTIVIGVILKTSFWLSDKFNQHDRHK